MKSLFVLSIRMLGAAVGVCLQTVSATAQEKSQDQVGLVFPAFSIEGSISDNAIGKSVAFALKLTVQASLAFQDPVTKEIVYGRGITFYIPAMMAEANHGAAAKLARINGLQGTVWGYASELVDGIAIQPYLTIVPPYEDYRETQQEIWEVNLQGETFRLGPPQQTVTFLPETVPMALVTNFGDPSVIDYCREDNDACVQFEDAQVSRVWSVAEDGTARIRRAGTDYLVKLPSSGLYTSEVVDYANLFIAYTRGNLNQAVQLADRYLKNHRPSGTVIDAHLYKAAALARMDNFELADAEIRAAMKLNPLARRTLRYGIMLEIARSGEPNERSKELFEILIANFGITDSFDLSYSKLN